MPFIFNIYGEMATMCCVFFPHSPFIHYYMFLLSYPWENSTLTYHFMIYTLKYPPDPVLRCPQLLNSEGAKVGTLASVLKLLGISQKILLWFWWASVRVFFCGAVVRASRQTVMSGRSWSGHFLNLGCNLLIVLICLSAVLGLAVDDM